VGFTDEERSDLVGRLETDARVVAVTLQVSFERALERVRADADPGRVASRNPAILRWLHGQFDAALPFLAANSTLLEADGETAGNLAGRISGLVLAEIG
jgi:hypothetical protein